MQRSSPGRHPAQEAPFERHPFGGSERSTAALHGLGVAAALVTWLGACSSEEARVVTPGAEAGAESFDDDRARARITPALTPAGTAGAGSGGGSGAGSAGGAGRPPGESADAGSAAPEAFVWNLPPGFPPPIVPEDNPMTAAKVELGRHLFYDVRLSRNETMSCASCHRQELAFTDGKAVAVGSTGEAHSRGSMSLANVAYAATLTWGHPSLTELERQAIVPMFGDAPVELGLTSERELEERLSTIPEYESLFAAAFPEEDEPITVLNVTRALAAFQRTLISGRSPYDRWAYDGDDAALGDAAKRGFALFYSERLECFHCHLGFNMTDHVSYVGQRYPATPFHNTGLYNIDGAGAFPEPNRGVYEVTRNPDDMGKHKAPTLRNIAVTAPYMHDGSIATLSEVLDHYAAGGRTIASGPHAGVGSESPLTSDLLRGFTLTEAERADVIAFLESLTDPEFLENPAFANPWQE